VNPLEVWPETCIENSSKAHVKAVRQKWFDCACCPTNVARTLTSLGQYIYFIKDGGLFINLFIQNEASFEINGKIINVSVKTDYPKTGNVRITVKAGDASFPVNIRIPGFAKDFSVSINGAPIAGENLNGYFRVTRAWNGDELAVSFALKPRLIYANPKVRQNCGKIAIARGPEMYCLEEIDNGKNLAALSIDPQSPLEECWREDLLGGVMLVKAGGVRLLEPDAPESFSEQFTPLSEAVELTALPDGLWGNRESGEMLVWIRGA
jgi:DUF1680 family protein